MKSERVLAADPGGRSGWATARMSTDRLELGASGVFERRRMALEVAGWQAIKTYGQNPTPSLEEYADLALITKTPLFDVLVVESWRPFRINGTMDWIENDLLLPAQHVGQFNLVAMLSGAEYVEQHPSDKKTFLANYPDVMKAIDAESNEQHDQDARLHLWGYFFREWFTGRVDPEDTVIV